MKLLNAGFGEFCRGVSGVLLLSSLVFFSCGRKSGSDDSVYLDKPFWQEYHEGYSVGTSPEENDVRSIAVDDESNVWIATGAGIFQKKKDSTIWNSILLESETGPSFSVFAENKTTWLGYMERTLALSK